MLHLKQYWRSIGSNIDGSFHELVLIRCPMHHLVDPLLG